MTINDNFDHLPTLVYTGELGSTFLARLMPRLSFWGCALSSAPLFIGTVTLEFPEAVLILSIPIEAERMGIFRPVIQKLPDGRVSLVSFKLAFERSSGKM
jgi:hypothetical protein